MTKEQEELKEQIRIATEALTSAHNHLEMLRQSCKQHLWKNSGWGSVNCAVCGKDGGWYCPKSPNSCCEYDENEECIYCGQPEERK